MRNKQRSKHRYIGGIPGNGLTAFGAKLFAKRRAAAKRARQARKINR